MAVTAGGASRGEHSSSVAAESALEKKQKKRSKRRGYLYINIILYSIIICNM